MKKYGYLFILGIFLVACAPKVQERKFDDTKTSFGPRFGDTDLSKNLKQADQFQADMSWQGVVSTASYFQQAENLVVLGKTTGRSSLMTTGLNWVESFYRQPQTSTYADFSQSPFATLAATETEDQVQQSLQDIHSELDRSRTTLRNKITALGKSYPWATQDSSLKSVLDEATAFTQLVYVQTANMGLPKEVSDGVRAELKKQTQTLFANLRPLVDQLYTATVFSKAISLIDSVIAQFGVNLQADQALSLKQGHQIGKDLDSLSGAQGALTLLIDVWKVLSPDQRQQYFQTESSALYDFLSKQSDSELNCLRQDGCSGGFFKGIEKKLFILPQIQQYGLTKLHDLLNQKALAYLIQTIEGFSQNFVTTLPNVFVQQIDQGLVAKDKELQGIQKNYPGYLKSLLSKWAAKALPNYNGKVAGFEAPSLSIDISAQKKMSLASAGDALDLKATTAGSSMTANALLLQNSTVFDDFKMQTALSQVNKLIAIGGYRGDDKKLVPAIMSPIQKTSVPLDLMNFTKSSYSYRIPDKIKMLDSFHVAEDRTYNKDFSAAAYAEQIKGLSQMMMVTADWKQTSFDNTLGKVKAQDLTNEIQSPSLDRALFPKDMLFTLNLGDAAVLLKNITKQATPVFLITLSNKTIWADQYDSGNGETAIMAGLVDIKNGQRASTVQSQDVAKFILAISDFMTAIDGVENTKSSILLEKDQDGNSPLQTLIGARQDLRLLVIALANFISNQMMNDQAIVQTSYSLQNMKPLLQAAFAIEDQAYAIRALIAAYQITQLDAYLFSAEEIYFAMNKNAFSVDEHFYVNGDGSTLIFPQKVHTLRAMTMIKPYLPEASQAQLDKIANPWLSALENLR